MTEDEGIYGNRSKNFDTQNNKLNGSEMTAQDKQLIQAWQVNSFARNTRKYRIGKLTGQVLELSTMAHFKPFLELTWKDIEQILAAINTRERWSEATKGDYRRALKQFLLWLEDNDPKILAGDIARTLFYKQVKKKVSISYAKKKINYSDIVTEADISKVIDACILSRDKALIAMLHEGGLRIGEALGMRIKDVEFSTKGAILSVDGKTGRRRVPVKIITPGHLRRWISEHPYKSDLNTPLWITFTQNARYKPLMYRGVVKMLAAAFKRANVDKKCNCHWLRHSRATIVAEYMPDAMRCQLFGWVQGSDQPRTYTHTDASQVDKLLNVRYGLTEEEVQITHQTCHKCQALNDKFAKFCAQCSHPLSLDAYNEKEKHEEFAIQLMQKIIADPSLHEKYTAFLKGKESLSK